MSAIEVHISVVDNQLKPSVDPINLSKKAGNTVKWFNDTKEEIKLTFDKGSPFPAKLHPYAIPAGKHTNSGPIEAAADTKWKYTISSGKLVTDPDVIIQG